MTKVRKGRQGWTNQVLLQKQRQKTIYYIPCYLRLKIKNFVSISIAAQQAEINADLIFTLFYGNLPSFIVEQLCDNIIFQFNRNQAVQLTRSVQISLTKNQKHRTLSFTIRKNLCTKIECNFFWSPFELVYLALVITIRSMNIDNPLQSQLPVVLRFNLMDHECGQIKISHTKQDSFGNYRLAPYKLRVFYDKELFYDPDHHLQREQEEQDLISLQTDISHTVQAIQKQELERDQNRIQAWHSDKVEYYQYAHFVIPMYKYPFISLFTIFFPMWSLALYNLFMYYQGTDMSMKIINGVTLDLSLFAYIPTIREQLPETPNVLLVELLVYSITLTFHFTLIDSYQVSSLDPSAYVMDWQTNIWFQMSLGITLFSVVILIILSLLHKLWWEPKYLKTDQFNATQDKFNRLNWKNTNCDQYFHKFEHIQILTDQQDFIKNK